MKRLLRPDQLSQLRQSDDLCWLLALMRARNALFDQVSRGNNEWPRKDNLSLGEERKVWWTFFILSSMVVECRVLAERLPPTLKNLQSFRDGLGSLLDESSVKGLWKSRGSAGPLAELRNRGVFHFGDVEYVRKGLSQLPDDMDLVLVWDDGEEGEHEDRYYPLADAICVGNIMISGDKTVDLENSILSEALRLARRVCEGLDSLIDELWRVRFADERFLGQGEAPPVV